MKKFEDEQEKTPVYLVEANRIEINEQLDSRSSILLLETVPSLRSHCRATRCILRNLCGRPNIESDFRFNLLDLTGELFGGFRSYPQPNMYYHVTCMEQIFDLPTLIEPGQIKMSQGFQASMFGDVIMDQGFHKAIEDWFDHKGASFNVADYDRYDQAYEDWNGEFSVREVNHQLNHMHGQSECSCGPAPNKPNKSDYFAQDRTPRLLSEVLAAVAKVKQIDHVPRMVLNSLAKSRLEENNNNKDETNMPKELLNVPARDAAASDPLLNI